MKHIADVVQESGCANAQINLPSNVDYRKEVLSLALTAKTSGSSIVFKANGCHGTTPTINSANSDNGYFYLK